MTYALHVGDAAAILPGLGIRPQLILTSPPYGGLRDYGGHGFDFEPMADALVGVLPVGGVLVWIVADQVIDGGESGDRLRQALGFMERGLRLHQTMVYVRLGTGGKAFRWRHWPSSQLMFVLSNGRPARVNKIRDVRNIHAGRSVFSGHRSRDGAFRHSKPGVIGRYRERSDVWEYMAGGEYAYRDFRRSRDHPATFPLQMAADHVRTWTNPGDLVLDPMAGSGTTLRAAETLGRDSVGIEIHAPYAEIIRERMLQRVLAPPPAPAPPAAAATLPLQDTDAVLRNARA